MSHILHFRKQLTATPVAVEAPDIAVRPLHLPDDLGQWLALRIAAMSSEKPAARAWNVELFHTEMTRKTWWRSDRSWVAVSTDHATPNIIGAVTLAMREGDSTSTPVVHWLLVDPAWRRRGVAHLLMTYVEAAAWNDGHREIQLETHAGWQAACAFYQSVGYVALRDRSLR
jgi:GNAT superfamily N-acetyltransferase